MTDKPRTIQYEKTQQGYMKFTGLSEYPTLADIKYLVFMTMKHFAEAKNVKRYDELKTFLYDVISATKIQAFEQEYKTLNDYDDEQVPKN